MSSDAFRRRVQPQAPAKKCSQCKVHRALLSRPDERCQSCAKVFDETQKLAREHAQRMGLAVEPAPPAPEHRETTATPVIPVRPRAFTHRS